jgi:hypothetical protein
MKLPEIRNHNVGQYLNTAAIVEETAQQIMKDFGLFGVIITFSGNTDQAYVELHGQLIDQVSVLMERDFGRLLSVLYQVDISEKEIARAEMELPEYNQVEIIAHQIIVRDLKKVLTRHYFKSNPGF